MTLSTLVLFGTACALIGAVFGDRLGFDRAWEAFYDRVNRPTWWWDREENGG